MAKDQVATRRGRPTKRTQETISKILQAIEMGATKRLASLYAGIDISTFMDWQARFPDFSEQVKKAEAKSALRWLAKIEQAANEGSWQAAAWKLERLYKDEYGRHVNTAHAGPDGGAIQVTHGGTVSIEAVLDRLSSDVVERLAEVAAEMDAEEQG